MPNGRREAQVGEATAEQPAQPDARVSGRQQHDDDHDNAALEEQIRLTKEIEDRRHKADEERKKLEMERLAAELEQKRAMERANLEKEEKERMVCVFVFRELCSSLSLSTPTKPLYVINESPSSSRVLFLERKLREFS